MNELREQVDVLVGRVFHHEEPIGKTTDAILALIAEAMLSEDAVEAAAKAIASGNHIEWEDTYEPYLGYTQSLKDHYRTLTSSGVAAALAAAGITGAGQEGGE